MCKNITVKNTDVYITDKCTESIQIDTSTNIYILSFFKQYIYIYFKVIFK